MRWERQRIGKARWSMVDGGKGNGKEHREFFLFNTELFVFLFFLVLVFFFFVLLNMVVRCLTWWCLFVFLFFIFFGFVFLFFLFYYFFFNIVLTWKFVEVSKAYIVLTWKFVEVSKASVLYIYRLTYIWAGRLGYNFKRGSSFLKGAQIFFFKKN